MKIDKNAPRIILDDRGSAGSVYPKEASAADPMMVTEVMRALGKSGRKRLSDFCSIPPALPGDPLFGAKNIALFRLRSRKYSFAVAVKTFRFPGYATELFPVEADADGVLLDGRLIGAARRILSDLFPSLADGTEPDGPSLLPSLRESLTKAASVSDEDGAERMISTVVRQLSSRPGAVCGEIRLPSPAVTDSGESRGSIAVSPGALACILSLLASALSGISDSRSSEIRARFEGGALRIDVTSRPRKAPRGFFATEDVLSLGGALGARYGAVAAASVIAAAENVSLSSTVGEDSSVGFRVTLFPSFGDAPEFKEDPEYYLLDVLSAELELFLSGTLTEEGQAKK